MVCFLPQTHWQMLIALPVMGFVTLSIHAGFAVYFPELFPDHLRATGASFCFNTGRLLAALGPKMLQLSATKANGAQIALMNPFGIRRSLVPAADGSLTFGDIYAVQPFNNDLFNAPVDPAK